MQHRETQFIHDTRKKEREYNRLKERLGQVHGALDGVCCCCQLWCMFVLLLELVDIHVLV